MTTVYGKARTKPKDQRDPESSTESEKESTTKFWEQCDDESAGWCYAKNDEQCKKNVKNVDDEKSVKV